METDSLRKHDLEDEDEDDVVTMSFQTTANPISSIISNVQPHDDILFSHVNPILVSSLRSEKLGLSLQWGPWESRFLNIYSNGNLIVYKNKDNNLLQQIHHWIDTFILRSSNSSTSSETNNIISILNLQDASISTLALDQDNVVTLNTSIKKEVGLYVKCKYHSGQETYIRCIIDEENLQYFRNAFDQINANNRASAISSMKSANPIPLKSFSNQKHSIMVSTQSVMRRAITHAMDTYMIQSRHDRILSRRGAFACLPVLFHNDLIHGSWWFVGGSFWMIILASVVLLNSFQDYLYGNTNDSILSRKNYEATWVLNLLAGIFFLLGSLAFVRAFHDTPPMKPLFHYYYHLQSDELLGSWLFVAASIPALPYMVIYMIEATTNQAIYLCGLVVSTLIVIGSYLFVVSSYPTDDVKVSEMIFAQFFLILLILSFIL